WEGVDHHQIQTMPPGVLWSLIFRTLEPPMHSFPHHYRTNATASSSGSVALGSPGLPDMETTAPPEFNGPEGFWSPETLLVGAVADCFILSFRAVAQASKFDWVDLRVEVEGTLDRVE